jgi:hypothetical protein
MGRLAFSPFLRQRDRDGYIGLLVHVAVSKPREKADA